MARGDKGLNVRETRGAFPVPRKPKKICIIENEQRICHKISIEKAIEISRGEPSLRLSISTSPSPFMCSINETRGHGQLSYNERKLSIFINRIERFRSNKLLKTVNGARYSPSGTSMRASHSA